MRNRPAWLPSQCHAGAYANRVVVVVDEDIDPADMNQVVWAICTRVRPARRRQHSGWVLEHAAWIRCRIPPDRRNLNSRMVIDACVPWNMKQDWPDTVRASAPLEKHLRTKFNGVLPSEW